jgi:hypothetical protein
MPNAAPPQRFAWDIYRAAARARWTGRVIASSVDEAVNSAAIECPDDLWQDIGRPLDDLPRCRRGDTVEGLAGQLIASRDEDGKE